jgi:hypothetical protein
MPEDQGSPPARSAESLDSLRRAKAKRLDELLKHKRGEKHYKKALRAYLDADGALQKALLERLGLNEVF